MNILLFTSVWIQGYLQHQETVMENRVEKWIEICYFSLMRVKYKQKGCQAFC